MSPLDGYLGLYNVVMDEKGRISLPARVRPLWREGMPHETMVLTKGLDRCLILYPSEEWAKIQERLDTLPFTRKDFRFFSRLLYSSAVLITLDRQGRLLIPSHLKEDAGLTKDVLVLGVNRWIEFWNPDEYRKFVDEFGRSYEQVAESLFDINHVQKE